MIRAGWSSGASAIAIGEASLTFAMDRMTRILRATVGDETHECNSSRENIRSLLG